MADIDKRKIEDDQSAGTDPLPKDNNRQGNALPFQKNNDHVKEKLNEKDQNIQKLKIKNEKLQEYLTHFENAKFVYNDLKIQISKNEKLIHDYNPDEFQKNYINSKLLYVKLRTKFDYIKFMDSIFAPIIQFTQSGVFFIILGLALLWYAKDNLGSTHPSLNLVLVTLGTAIILYGTGTQGLAKFNNNGDTANKVNIEGWFAGGAGVLALVIALGFTLYPGKVKQAFSNQIHYGYIRMVLPDNMTDDNEDEFINQASLLQNYTTQQTKAASFINYGLSITKVMVNHKEVPILRTDEYYEAVIPYTMGQKENINITYYGRVNDSAGTLIQKPITLRPEKLKQLLDKNDGIDMPHLGKIAFEINSSTLKIQNENGVLYDIQTPFDLQTQSENKSMEIGGFE